MPIKMVLQRLLEAASPNAQSPLHWRYNLMSLAMFLFILPPVDDASAKVRTALRQILKLHSICVLTASGWSSEQMQ